MDLGAAWGEEESALGLETEHQVQTTLEFPPRFLWESHKLVSISFLAPNRHCAAPNGRRVSWQNTGSGSD